MYTACQNTNFTFSQLYFQSVGLSGFVGELCPKVNNVRAFIMYRVKTPI